MMLKLLKSGILSNTVIATVLFACVSEIKSEELHREKYMETFLNNIHKLLMNENITEYVILGKIKREDCDGCTTDFWSGGLVGKYIPIKSRNELTGMVYQLTKSSLSSVTVNSTQTKSSETVVIPDNENKENLGPVKSQSEKTESASAAETINTEKQNEPFETFRTEKSIQAQFRDEDFSNEPYVQTRNLCQNGTQMQTGGVSLKFEYMLLSAAFLYVTVVTLVYLTVFCRRPKGYDYQSSIGSISGDAKDMA